METIGLKGTGGFTAAELVHFMLEPVPVAVAPLNRDFRCIAHNSRFITDFGLDRKKVIGSEFVEIFPNEAETVEFLKARMNECQPVHTEIDRYVQPDGTVDFVRWSMTPWCDDKGDLQGVVIVCEITTEQIQETLQARVVDEELSLFVDIAENFALCMLDDEGRVTIWNSGAERLCGWNEGEVIGQHFDFMFEEGDRKYGLPARQLEIARLSGTFRDRCWRIDKNGKRFLADVTISRVEGDELLPSGFGQIIRDVTEEDAQARSLEASTVLLRAIIDTVPDALVVIDEQGLVLSFSKAAENLFGYTPQEVIGQNVSILMPSPDREAHDAYVKRYLTTGDPKIIGTSRRVIGQRKDGTIFPLELRVAEAFGGGMRTFAGFMRDLSEKEAAEADLQNLQKELTHIARISEMGTLATAIAHELNQPLMAISNIVQTSAELVKAEDNKNLAVVARALGEAGSEALRAGDIVKRLRNFIARGELERTIEDPESLAKDACQLVAGDAKVKGINCSFEVAEGLGKILVDRVQVQQVLVNLIHNAMDAIGEEGTINIRIRPAGSMIHFTVADSGPGVPADQVDKLFEPFSTTKPTGMGMGLAICRKIVEAHEGELWFEESELGGACFNFTLPKCEGEKKREDDI